MLEYEFYDFLQVKMGGFLCWDSSATVIKCKDDSIIQRVRAKKDKLYLWENNDNGAYFCMILCLNMLCFYMQEYRF